MVLRVASVLLLAVLASGCSDDTPARPLTSPAPEPPARPSSEAIQALTGFPAAAFDGALREAALGRLAGKWVVTRQEWPPLFRLLEDPATKVQFHRVAFDGSRCLITLADRPGQPLRTVEWTAVPVPFCDPPVLDLVAAGSTVPGPCDPLPIRCVYALAGEELTLALGVTSEEWPTGFYPQPRLPQGAIRLVLRRE